MRVALCVSAVLAGAASMSAAAGQLLDVYRVGAGAGCGHATVQAALDAARLASGPSVVRIARNRGYTAQALVISDGDYVELAGGYDDCLDATPTERTVLDGTGGAAASVLTVTGNGDVVLRRLEITGGDAGTGDGGGLRVLGNGEVVVSDSVIHHNSAARGGGIFIDAAPFQLLQRVRLVDASAVQFNGASLGGGIYVTLSSFESEGSRICCNLASDSGAAIFATRAARVRLDRTLVDQNEAALDGGGLHASGGATVAYFGRGPGTAAIIGNRAGRHGGGVYVLADAPNQTTRVDAWSARIGGVSGHDGAGVFVREDNPNPAAGRASAIFAANEFAPEAGLALAPVELTRSATGVPPGAPTHAAYAVRARDGLAQLRLFRTRVSANRGAPLFRVEGASGALGASLLLVDSEIRDNIGEGLVLAPTGRNLVLDRATVAANDFGAAPLFDVGAAELALVQSIVYQPGSIVVRAIGPSLPFARHLLVHDSSSLPADVTIAQGDPRFVLLSPPGSIRASDLRLARDSPAVDFAPADAVGQPNAVDLDGRPRPVDLAEAPDEFGPLDLGAYETQLGDALFGDGYEDPIPKRTEQYR